MSRGCLAILSLIGAVLTTGSGAATAARADGVGTLGVHQRVALLEKALADFDAGVGMLESDPGQAGERLSAAAEGFESLIRSGVRNGRLYYNLANTYLQLGRLGKAIANYRRAEKLIPGDEQLKTNLGYARGLRRYQIEAKGSESLLRTLFFWHYRIPLATRFAAGLVLYVLFWLVLMIRPLFRQAGLPLIALLLAVGWLTLGASTAVQWSIESRTAAGVIVADEVVVRKGNSANYEPQVKQLLYEGVEFTLLEMRSGWLRIELPDGSTGWIRADQADLI